MFKIVFYYELVEGKIWHLSLHVFSESGRVPSSELKSVIMEYFFNSVKSSLLEWCVLMFDIPVSKILMTNKNQKLEHICPI